MSDIDALYPQSCPFCTIAQAYPPPSSQDYSSAVPEIFDIERIQPSCFLVLSAPQVLAFLDIMPMTKGHLLVIVRSHREKIQDLESAEGREIGFWLPILARAVVKVTGVSDYNLVQNNGARAAQVVAHMHFHIIPRPSSVPELKSKSWTMFGRGQRDELDDDDAKRLAADLRVQIRKEIGDLERAKIKL